MEGGVCVIGTTIKLSMKTLNSTNNIIGKRLSRTPVWQKGGKRGKC